MVDNAECDCDVRRAIENEQLDDERAEQHGAVCKIEKNRPQVSPPTRVRSRHARVEILPRIEKASPFEPRRRAENSHNELNHLQEKQRVLYCK